jgi:hypothetical protein
MDFVLFDDHLDDFDLDASLVRPLYSTLPPLAPTSTRTPSLHKAPPTISVSRNTSVTASRKMAAVSPSSSPRLPSPPPFTEVQIGPQSPTVGDIGGEQLFAPLAETDDGSTRRIRPGTKAVDMASGLPLVPLSQVLLFYA